MLFCRTCQQCSLTSIRFSFFVLYFKCFIVRMCCCFFCQLYGAFRTLHLILEYCIRTLCCTEGFTGCFFFFFFFPHMFTCNSAPEAAVTRTLNSSERIYCDARVQLWNFMFQFSSIEPEQNKVRTSITVWVPADAVSAGTLCGREWIVTVVSQGGNV